MKKILLFGMLLVMSVVNSQAQITFTKFKLKPSILITSKNLDESFIVSGDKTAKYVKVEWCAVNTVGDVVGGSTRRMLRKVSATGPFVPGKKQKLQAMAAFIGVEKVFAMPVNVSIDYMDGTDWEVDITKENYKKYFPELEWINFDVPGEMTSEEKTDLEEKNNETKE